jgi:hypothetical protein
VNVDISKSIVTLLGGFKDIVHDWSGPYIITYVRRPNEVGTRKSGSTTYANVLIKPANPQSKAFGDALCELLAARVNFESKAEEDYGSGNPEAEEIYNRACDKLWGVLLWGVVQDNFERKFE